MQTEDVAKGMKVRTNEYAKRSGLHYRHEGSVIGFTRRGVPRVIWMSNTTPAAISAVYLEPVT